MTFVRPDQWLRDGVSRHAPDPGAALADVFRRYLSAYGPATARDFAQWFYLPPRAARDLATTLGTALQEVDVEGYRGYVLAEEASASGDGGADEVLEHLPVRLLPHFDCYAIGCHPRNRLLPAAWAARVPPRTTPSQLPLLLVDGTVAGVWQRATKGKRLVVRVELFVPLNRRQHALLEEEARRIGAILGAEAALEIGPIAIRPHL